MTYFNISHQEYRVGGQTPVGKIVSITGPFFSVANCSIVWVAQNYPNEVYCTQSSFETRLMEHSESGNRLFR